MSTHAHRQNAEAPSPPYMSGIRVAQSLGRGFVRRESSVDSRSAPGTHTSLHLNPHSKPYHRPTTDLPPTDHRPHGPMHKCIPSRSRAGLNLEAVEASRK